MDECIKNSDHQNFVCLYLAFAYVGYQLKGYTETGLKKVHAHICRKLGNEPKCTSRCSETYGRNVKKWCNTCRSWQNDLQEILCFKAVAWERMKSWNWPTSYINIEEVFVPTICSMHTINLKDLYTESYIWANCKEFNIDQNTLKSLREARNAIVHNSTTLVTKTQKDNCFDAMQTLISDQDVIAYLNVVECKEILSSLHDNEAKVFQQKYTIFSTFGRFGMKENREDVAEIENEKSSKFSDHSRERDIHENFKIHQTIIKSLTAVMTRPYCVRLRFTEVTLFSYFFSSVILLLYLLYARSEMIQAPLLLVRKIFAYFPLPYLLAFVFRSSEHLIRHYLQHKDVKCQELEKTVKNLVTGRGEWDRCLKAEDTALMADLLNSDHLPNKKQLKRACTMFTRFSIIIGLTTDKICEIIKKKNVDKVKRVWAAYEPDNENDIIFVIVTKELNAPLDFKPKYDVKYRQDGDFSSESKDLVLEESKQNLNPDEVESFKIQQCTNKHTSKLMEKHSNLTIISSSLLKSKGYGTKHCVTERKACVVLHVHIKGLIPLKESMFPKSLDGIDVDVREGCLEIHSGKGPHEKHENVKIGCGIKAKEQDDCGTLGGFLEHPKLGLCALTCAHLFTGNMKITEDKRQSCNVDAPECIQPCYELHNVDGSRFGELSLIVIKKGSSDGDISDSVGLDYAIIAIDRNREPLDGSFPFVPPKLLNAAGFKDQSCLSFETGEVVDFKVTRSRSTVIKYGSTTHLTCGVLPRLNPTVSFKDATTGLTLMNQIQINFTRIGDSDTDCFSKGGDSGALVFHVDAENNLSAIGLLVGGHTNLGFGAATPICNILSDIKIKKLKQFPSQLESEERDLHQFNAQEESTLQKKIFFLFCSIVCACVVTYFLL